MIFPHSSSGPWLHAQKLESVGQLAAGIAHEIKTSTQFIGTNIDFFAEATQDIAGCIEQIQGVIKTAPQKIAYGVTMALEEIDWEYLAEESPSSHQSIP